jgi:hypothetical protein
VHRQARIAEPLQLEFHITHSNVMTARLWVFCPTMASEIGGQTITALMDRQYRKRGAAGPRPGPRACNLKPR